jgi:hypothetical protein
MLSKARAEGKGDSMKNGLKEAQGRAREQARPGLDPGDKNRIERLKFMDKLDITKSTSMGLHPKGYSGN